MTVPYAAEIERVLCTLRPRSLLAIGAPAQTLLADYAAANDCRYVALPSSDLATLSDTTRFDLAMVAPATDAAGKTRALQSIAALRDRYARHLLVVIDAGARGIFAPTDFFALGLRHVGDYGADATHHALYEYDIVDYKDTPDWLNSEHWAHPELFDKFRW